MRPSTAWSARPNARRRSRRLPFSERSFDARRSSSRLCCIVEQSLCEGSTWLDLLYHAISSLSSSLFLLSSPSSFSCIAHSIPPLTQGGPGGPLRRLIIGSSAKHRRCGLEAAGEHEQWGRVCRGSRRAVRPCDPPCPASVFELGIRRCWSRRIGAISRERERFDHAGPPLAPLSTGGITEVLVARMGRCRESGSGSICSTPLAPPEYRGDDECAEG